MFLDARGGIRASWRFLLFVLLYAFLVVCLAWAIAPAVEAVARRLSLDFQLAALFGIVLVSAIAVLLATSLMLGAIEHRRFDFVGLDPYPAWGWQLGAGFGAGLGLMTLIVALEAFTHHLRLSVDVSRPAYLVPLLFSLVLFALGALHEELLFRGYAFQRLIDILGPATSTLLLGAAFGAVHLGNPNASRVGAVNTALVGILFALLYLRSGRLWLPIGVHWGWNFAEAGFGLPVSGITIGQTPLHAEYQGATLFHGGPYGPEASIFATVVIALATLLVFYWKPAVPQRVSKELT